MCGLDIFLFTPQQYSHRCTRFCVLLLTSMLFTPCYVYAEEPPAYIKSWDLGEYINNPTVAVSNNGTVYVVDSENNRIFLFDADGNLFDKWGGTPGSGIGEFNLPRDIAVDNDNNVYVADSGNVRIQKFDANGKFVTQWGTKGTAEGQFNIPTYIAIDKNNAVYVVDRGNSRIQKFDANGNFLVKWNIVSPIKDYGLHIMDIAVDANSNIYVGVQIPYGELTYPYIQKIDANGNYLTSWLLVYFVSSIAVDNYNNIYASTGNGIRKYDGDGNLLSSWQFEGPFYSTGNLAVDSQNAIYVASGYGNFLLQKFAYIYPAAPSALIARVKNSQQIDLHWADNSKNETGFKVERCLTENCVFKEIATVTVDGTNYSDAGLDPGISYSYRIRSTNSSGDSPYSNNAYAATLTSSAAPTGLAATINIYKKVQLLWIDNADNEIGFSIERCEGKNCQNFSEIATVGSNVTQYVDTKSQLNTRYRYRIRVYNTIGLSAYSNVAGVRTQRALRGFGQLGVRPF